MAGAEIHPDTLFNAARRLEDPQARRAYLDQACGGDQQLREKVEALLRAHATAGTFLEPPADAAFDPNITLDAPTLLTPPGTVVGHYKLLEPVGEGGYGTVFMAEQTSPVHRKVALKIIKAGMDTRQVIARFEAERQALALMDHPNIAKVHDAGVTETGRPYFVMELVKGVPITKYCDEHHLPPRDRLELFVQVCQAVQHAHQKGIIHRDLKPTNVLVALYDGKPVPKVIDFGVAKATGQQLTEKTMFTGFGDVIGTPEYMSPEQAELNQLDIDTRSDIYSLGVLLYELLTGTTPIEHKRVREAALLEVLRVVREEDPPRPSTRLSTAEQLPTIAANRGLEPRKLSGLVKGELDWIVMKALEKDRGRRYETANGFARDIERYLADEPVQACPPSAAYRFRKFSRRHRAALMAAALMLILLVAGIIGTTTGMVRAWNAEQDATDQRNKALALLGQVQAAKSEAERAAGRAQALSGFLTEAFGAANPSIAGGGRDAKVADVLDRAAARLSEELAGQPEAEIEARLTIGKAYDGLGLYPAAVENLRRAHDLARATYGDDEEQTLRSANSLHWSMIEKGDYRDAEPLAKQTLETAKRRFSTTRPVTWDAAHNYAYSLTNAWRQREPGREARFAEALPINKQLVDWIRQAPGEQHRRRLANAMHALAIVLSDQGGSAQLAEAEQLERDAVALLRSDPNAAPFPRMQTRLAQILMQRGKFDEAKREFKAALADQRQRLGDKHQTTSFTRVVYAHMLVQKGDHQEAADTYEELIQLMRAGTHIGQQPQNTILARLLIGLARARLALGQLEAALRAADDVLALPRAGDDPWPELVQEAWRLRAVALCSLGRFREAEQAWGQRIEQAPDEHRSWFFRGCILAYLQDQDAYERHCKAMLERFGDVTVRYEADRVAKTYLLVPRSPAQCQAVAPLVDRAVEGEEDAYFRFYRMLKGLAEYRAGRFDTAVHWLNAAHDDPPPSIAAVATIDLLLAMSHHQLRDADASRAAFDRAKQMIAAKLSTLDTGDVSVGRFGQVEDWLICQVIFREAKQLLAEQAPGNAEVKP